MITPEVLARLRALHEATTKGWEAHSGYEQSIRGNYVSDERGLIVCAEQGQTDCVLRTEDRDLIVEMRNALPDMLDRIAELEAELKLTVDAEMGRAGLPGWRYSDTGLCAWSRWCGPKNEDGESWPLLVVKHQAGGLWGWEVYDGLEYTRMPCGTAEGALAAMRAAEAAAHPKVQP